MYLAILVGIAQLRGIAGVYNLRIRMMKNIAGSSRAQVLGCGDSLALPL
jgi:hypothetical protein